MTEYVLAKVENKELTLRMVSLPNNSEIVEIQCGKFPVVRIKNEVYNKYLKLLIDANGSVLTNEEMVERLLPYGANRNKIYTIKNQIKKSFEKALYQADINVDVIESTIHQFFPQTGNCLLIYNNETSSFFSEATELYLREEDSKIWKKFGMRLSSLFSEDEINEVMTAKQGSTWENMLKSSAKDMHEILRCMCIQGLSGKMGKHSLRSISEAGNVFAIQEVAELYYYGEITPDKKPDYKKAYEYYCKAYESGTPFAAYNIGYMMVKHIPGPEEPIDYSVALRYLKEAAINWLSAPALVTIGEMWETGKYPRARYDHRKDFDSLRFRENFEERNIDKALQFYELASDMGYHYATNRLARHYEVLGDKEKAKAYSLTMRSDLEKKKELLVNADNNHKIALKYYLKSVEQISDGYNCNRLGQMYEAGNGCLSNKKEAAYYYLKGIDVYPDDRDLWCDFNAGRVKIGSLEGMIIEDAKTVQEGILLICGAANQLIRSNQKNKIDQMILALSWFINSYVDEKDAIVSNEVSRLKPIIEHYCDIYITGCQDKGLTINQRVLSIKDGLAAEKKNSNILAN